MEALLLSMLLALGRFEGARDVPVEVPSTWASSNEWQQTPSGWVFEASSNTLSEQCRTNPDGYIRFPVVPYGAHEISSGGNKIVQFGNPKMDTPNFVLSAPVLECHSIEAGAPIHWRISAYSKFFAKVQTYPTFTNVHPMTKLFGETLYVGSAIGLLILALFAMSVLWGKESNRLMISLCSSIAGLAIYQFSLIAPAFEVDLSMLTVHRIGDVGLSLGIMFVIQCFYIEKLIPRWLFGTHVIATALSMPFILLGTNGDTIQFGTNVPMITVLLSFGLSTYNLCREFLRNRKLDSAFKFAFNLIFVCVVANDISIFEGTATGYTFMSVGSLFAFLILLLAVNQRISETYVERDYLRGNLEKEVERKTAELQAKTVELESTMQNLQHTQAELIHSAKLASLGTLSAGIAHEINNSINFVNGAIPPLEKLVAKLDQVSARDAEIGKKLLHAIKDGVGITVEIVKSLRNFTGLNQSKLKDMQLVEVVKSVTTILRPRLKDSYEVEVNVADSLYMYGDVVGINQVLMNLITNAVDAMPKGGKITISAHDTADMTVVEVQDNGEGIPEKIRQRIFDPFFTTKEVGSGTGLGLYIISKEISRHQGKIAVESEVGQGTKFVLSFPKRLADDKEVAA